MKWLLDTNVLSELRKPDCDANVRKLITGIRPDDFALSVIVLGELSKGAQLLKSGKRRRELEQWIDATHTSFAKRIVFIDTHVALAWASIAAGLQKKGRIMSMADGLIAATALHHGMTLVTRNVKDFKSCGVKLFNPWG